MTFLIFSVFISTQLVFAQDRKLGFDLEAAESSLFDRRYSTTSPFFENTYDVIFGLGFARSGLIWGDTYVSSATRGSMILTQITPIQTRKAGDTFVEFASLRWNEDRQAYVGQGTYFGRGYSHCPLNPSSAKIEVQVYKSHPFLGAWSQIKVDYLSNEVFANCTTGKITPVTWVKNRVFTNVEVLRALEQADEYFDDGRGRIERYLAAVEPRINEIDDAEERNRRFESLARARAALDTVETFINELDWALKFGGRVTDLSGKVHRFENPVGTEQANSTLFNLTGTAMNEAINALNLAQKLEDRDKK